MVRRVIKSDSLDPLNGEPSKKEPRVFGLRQGPRLDPRLREAAEVLCGYNYARDIIVEDIEQSIQDSVGEDLQAGDLDTSDLDVLVSCVGLMEAAHVLLKNSTVKEFREQLMGAIITAHFSKPKQGEQ